MNEKKKNRGERRVERYPERLQLWIHGWKEHGEKTQMQSKEDQFPNTSGKGIMFSDDTESLRFSPNIRVLCETQHILAWIGYFLYKVTWGREHQWNTTQNFVLAFFSNPNPLFSPHLLLAISCLQIHTDDSQRKSEILRKR
jgi:hypothetical protein